MNEQEQGLGDGPRLALAVALSAGVLYIWSVLFPPPPPVENPTPDGNTAELGVPGVAPGLPGLPGALPNLGGVDGAPSAAGVEPLDSYPEVTVNTPSYEARFSTLGGLQTGMVLLDYPQTHEPDAEPVQLIDGHSSRGAFAFDLFPRSGKRRSTADIVFEPSTERLTLADGETGSLVFTGSYPGLGVIEKEYRFQGGAYAYDLEVRVQPEEGVAVDWAVLSLDEVGSPAKGGRWDRLASKVAYGTKIDDEDIASLRKDARKGKPSRLVYNQQNGKGPVRWAGFDEHYFLRVVLPAPVHEAMAQIEVKRAQSAPLGGAVEPIQLDVVTPFLADPESGLATFDYELYLGPKALDLLTEIEPTLPGSVELGYVAPLSRFFVRVLRYFYGVTGNWGVAIILLTIIVRMLMFPLTLKSMQSMERMRELQPEQNAIREKFKDEPEKMQREWMALYKRNKVSPLGGCLPMLLQFPIFIGLYYALAQAIELRHANFAFWLTDLSAPDPFYITPVLMGATMLWLQRMQPMAAMDPMQQKILQWMPVMFTFFFLNFPSGLVLYWLFSNFVSIGQQYWIRSQKKRKTVKSAAGSTS